MITNANNNIGGVNHTINSSSSGQHAPTNVAQSSRVSHRQADCKKLGKKALFVDPDDYEEEDAYVGEEPIFDGIDVGDEEILEGDTSPVLVVRQIYLTPLSNGDEWLHNNIFQSTCTI